MNTFSDAAGLERATALAFFSDSMGEVRRVSGVDCLVATRGESGHMIYGPYEPRPAGAYRIEFDLALVEAPSGAVDPVAAIIDVAFNSGQAIAAERHLTVSEMPRQLGAVSLEFSIAEPQELEYRVKSTGQARLAVSGSPRLTLLEAGRPRPPVWRPGSNERIWDNESEFLDGYLRNISGLVHVGANLGQEREYYRLLGLDVIWVEAIREMYDRLVSNIAGHLRQRACQALLTDKDGDAYDFNIANNNGASSSILPMDKHAELFPEIEYTEQRRLISTTLQTLLAREEVKLADYQALTIDVEGAEMLVLKGAGEMLKGFRYVKTEVADFTARVGSPTKRELADFMDAAGFSPLIQRPFATLSDGSSMWDVVWKRREPGEALHRPRVALPITAPPDDVHGMDKVHY